MSKHPPDSIPRLANNNSGTSGQGVAIQRIGIQGDNRRRIEDGPATGKLDLLHSRTTAVNRGGWTRFGRGSAGSASTPSR